MSAYPDGRPLSFLARTRTASTQDPASQKIDITSVSIERCSLRCGRERLQQPRQALFGPDLQEVREFVTAPRDIYTCSHTVKNLISPKENPRRTCLRLIGRFLSYAISHNSEEPQKIQGAGQMYHIIS